MPVVKNISASSIARDAIVFDLGDLRRQGDRVMAEARAQADEILKSARDEARRLVEDASTRGHKDGFEKGVAEGRAAGEAAGRTEAHQQMKASLEALASQWSTTLEQWEDERRRLALDAQQDVLTLALAAAEKITHRQIEVDPSVVTDQLERAIAQMLRPGTATVSIHPDDASLVEEALPGVLQRASLCEHVQVVTNASIERGGCTLRTGRGVIDATIQTQLRRLVETLLPGAGAAPESSEHTPDGSAEQSS